MKVPSGLHIDPAYEVSYVRKSTGAKVEYTAPGLNRGWRNVLACPETLDATWCPALREYADACEKYFASLGKPGKTASKTASKTAAPAPATIDGLEDLASLQ